MIRYPQIVKPEDIISSFYIPGEEGISEHWRKNKSPVEFRELVFLLKGIEKITAYMGRNVGTILWSGMEPTESNVIFLDPSAVLGRYPVPPSRADVAIGEAIHLGYKNTEWSDRAKNLAAKALNKELHDEDSFRYDRRFALFIEMAEDVYVDIVSNRWILGRYTEKYREYTFEVRRKNFIQPPTVDELLHLWWLMAAERTGQAYKNEFEDEMYGYYGYNLSRFYTEPLLVLNSIIGDLINKVPRISSVVERCELRAKLYLSIYEDLKANFGFWVTDIRDKKMIPRTIAEDVVEDKSQFKAIIAHYAKEMETLVSKSADITDEIRLICHDDTEVVPIKINDIVLPFKEPVDMSLLTRVQALINSKADKRKIISRGMESGKIDKRRLYRAPINGKVFMYKKTEFEMNNDIILVIDASGSMGGPKWNTIQMIFKVLYTALSNINKNARIFSYNETKGACLLTELSRGDNELYTVLPQGKTASGEAIIAAVTLIRRKTRRPYIIHITDGASNWGCSVEYAIEYCKKNRISLMTLGYGCSKSNKAALREEYGRQVEFIDNLQEFPAKFGKLLNLGKYYKN